VLHCWLVLVSWMSVLIIAGDVVVTDSSIMSDIGSFQLHWSVKT